MWILGCLVAVIVLYAGCIAFFPQTTLPTSTRHSQSTFDASLPTQHIPEIVNVVDSLPQEQKPKKEKEKQLPKKKRPKKKKTWDEIKDQDVMRGGRCGYRVGKERWETSINEILPGELFLGEQTAAASRDILDYFGIDVVFNMAPNRALNYFENETTRQQLRRLEYHTYAIRDKSTQDISSILDDVTHKMHRAIDVEGKTVFVHCSCGVSRSTSMVVAFLMRYRELSFQEALDFVTKKRIVAWPNDGFRRQLRQFELDLKKRKNHNT